MGGCSKPKALRELLILTDGASDERFCAAQKTHRRLFEGRLEKRLSMSVPVYLASLGEPRAMNERLRKTSVPTVPA